MSLHVTAQGISLKSATSKAKSTDKGADKVAISTLVVFAAKTMPKGGKAGKSEKSKKKEEGTLQVWTPSSEIETKVQEAFSDKVFAGGLGESYFLHNVNIDGYKNICAVGLNNSNDLTLEVLRRAGGSLARALKGWKVEGAGVYLPGRLGKIALTNSSQAVTEGVLLGTYHTMELKSDKSKHAPILKKIVVLTDTQALQEQAAIGCHNGNIIADSVNLARRLGDTPGNMMTPSDLAKSAQDAAKATGIKVTVWNQARIKKEKMHLLNGVALGSSEEPRFIIMEYYKGPKDQKPIAFVGKGLTFDSGGISIKPSANMEEMKFDMCGGANMIATMVAISKLKLKVNVVAYIPSSENMPGPSANKPGDIMAGRNGKTVEVNNTDAEGRLILADALAYACEKKPGVIIDAATLTGAMVMALGDTHSGYFTRDENLNKAIEEAAEVSGERIWRMPVIDEHGDDMKGAYGDLTNMAYNRGAGSAHGAAFLEAFVDKKIPFAHFDIAGTAWHIGHRYSYHPSKGASGIMIRTFIEFAREWKGTV